MIPGINTGGGGLQFSSPTSSASGPQTTNSSFEGGTVQAPGSGVNWLALVMVVAVAYVAAKTL